MARNNGGSATAFLRDDSEALSVRFFIPLGELALVGHASLAAAYVGLETLRRDAMTLTMARTGGTFDVHREADGSIGIDLPAVPPRPGAPPRAFGRGVG